MRKIKTSSISQEIAAACLQLNTLLPKKVSKALSQAALEETSIVGKSVLQKLCRNAELAAAENLPICQDTGTVIVFAEIGQEIQITGGSFVAAINRGIALGYKPLRKSMVSDPLERKNTSDNTPAVIHTSLVPGNKLKLTLLAKGGGAENKSQLKMFAPTIAPTEIKDFVVETVKKADAAACPPLIIGIGIGGTFDSCPILAKKALLRSIGGSHPKYSHLEQQILQSINRTGIGPAGYGGTITALAVHIETAPCHIASLPVAVNIQCHADRYLKIIL
jgi:fumarate hydratase subunit alpha